MFGAVQQRVVKQSLNNMVRAQQRGGGAPRQEATHNETSGNPHHHAEASPLLRTWRAAQTSPPVAPAVVVESEEDASGVPRYTYPVATFVRDFVRTSMDQMQHHHDFTLTTRSDPNLSSSVGADHSDPNTLTVRTMGDLGDDDAEYIIVDGEMIALPPPAPNHEEQLGYEEFVRDSEVRSCQPSRLRRGVRKLKKNLFRRTRNNSKTVGSYADEDVTTTISTRSAPPAATLLAPAVTGTSPVAAAAAAAARATAPRRPSTDDLKKKASPKRKNKRGHWFRNDSDQRQQQPETESESLSVAVASLPPRSTTTGVATVPLVRQERVQSTTASYVGTAEELLEAGVLPAGIAAEAYIEYDDESSKKSDGLVPSMVPRDADFKALKADAPDVETMLRRAAFETTTDLEASEVSSYHPPHHRRGKSDGSSIPLSMSASTDPVVHNDQLKIVMVGCLLEKTWLAKAIRQSTKRPRKRSNLAVDVHSWTATPVEGSAPPVKCSIWDTQGATSTVGGTPNFGGHPATQSLFFSPQSLYILVWDLAAGNPKTFPSVLYATVEGDESDSEDEYESDFAQEEANRQADRALQADIQAVVLPWADAIARRAPDSAILPVVIIPPNGMRADEVERRCRIMQGLLEEHIQQRLVRCGTAPKLLTGAEQVLRVSYGEGNGIDQLRDTIAAIATDPSHSVFMHVGTPVPEGTPLVLDIVRRLKQDHKLILLDYIVGEAQARKPLMTLEQVSTCLRFVSCVGEILYFGEDSDDVLARYVILCRKWLVSALSCVLRNDLKRELSETRTFMNMQCLYGDGGFHEHEMTRVLGGATTSSVPLLSDSDAKMLWQSMSFMREAADSYSQLGDSPTNAPTMFHFLETLLVHAGVLLPLEQKKMSLDATKVFFAPSLLAQVDPTEIWSLRTSEGWQTTLCHSWLIREGASSDLMEAIAVSLLSDLYEFASSFQTIERQPPHRVKTVPLGRSGTTISDGCDEHQAEPLRSRIHQIMCWQSSILVKIGTVFVDEETKEPRESFVEMLITIVDQTSNVCVATDVVRAGMHRLVVSAKGEVGHHGLRIWKGGYKTLLKSVDRTLKRRNNVECQIVCPQCLMHSHPHTASTWSWDSVSALAESGCAVVRCMRGHRVNSNLVGVPCKESLKPPPPTTEDLVNRTKKSVPEILPSVVMVGLWNPSVGKVVDIGSGFIVDRKLGLVLTAGHIMFDMEKGSRFGLPYHGVRDAKAVIGVTTGEGDNAVWRYFADICTEDIHNVDATVLRIRTRLENDVDDEGAGCADEPEVPLADTAALQAEQLKSLKLTNRIELEEPIRIIGFDQGGDGLYEKGTRINRAPDLAKGYVCKKFKAAMSDDSASQSSDSSSQFFAPREEIVVICPTISGHSGGPCVNEEGKVIGIVSRCDPVDHQRCYLVPASELKILVNEAKKICNRPAALTSMHSM